MKNNLDPEVRALCEAVNRFPGIQTTESCCGHGQYPFRIWFKSLSLASLPKLIYWFALCHCGFDGWSVKVTTDCACSPVTFMIEGPTGGAAYSQADAIAKLMAES